MRSGKPRFLLREHARAVGLEKCRGGAPKGVRPTSLGAGRRVMASPTCRSQGTFKVRRSAPAPFGAPPPRKKFQAAAAKAARDGQSVGCLKGEERCDVGAALVAARLTARLVRRARPLQAAEGTTRVAPITSRPSHAHGQAGEGIINSRGRSNSSTGRRGAVRDNDRLPRAIRESRRHRETADS